MTSASAPVNHTVDPLDAAMNATPRSLERTYFGQVTIVDAYNCVLVKGAGKQVYDSTQHTPDQRRTAIKLQVEVPKRDGGSYTLDQDCLDFEKSWLNFTLPSLRSINANLRTIKNAWVKVTRKPTGEKYENRTTGEWKDKTALVFLEIYPDQATMQAAADTFYSQLQQAQDNAADAAPAPTTQPAVNETERKFAIDALPMLWKAAKGDTTTFLGMIASNPLIAKYCTEQSSEVQAFIAGEQPF
jgi:hypothetical protein